MLLAAGALTHDDARQAFLALQPDHVMLEAEHRQDQPAGLVRHQLLPVGPYRIFHRRGHDLEVLGAVGIGEDEEDVAAFFQIILQADLARRHQRRLGQRLAGAEKPVFRCLMVVDADHDPVVGARAADIHEEAGIGLLVDQPIVLRTVAKCMEEHF